MDIKNEIQALQEQIDNLKAKQAEACKPKGLWVPNQYENYWFVTGTGYTSNCTNVLHLSDTTRMENGNCYRTNEQAEKASSSMQKHNRILAWLANHDDDWEADWNDVNQRKYGIYYDSGINEYCTDYWVTYSHMSNIVMSKENATELCKQLNEGEFTL